MNLEIRRQRFPEKDVAFELRESSSTGSGGSLWAKILARHRVFPPPAILSPDPFPSPIDGVEVPLLPTWKVVRPFPEPSFYRSPRPEERRERPSGLSGDMGCDPKKLTTVNSYEEGATCDWAVERGSAVCRPQNSTVQV